jgi:hypothetical protein
VSSGIVVRLNVRRRLTDGSKVCSVQIGYEGLGEPIQIDAIDANHAYSLVQEISDSIRRHSVEQVLA